MDPFAVLGLAHTFDIDLTAAETKMRQLSRALHPDKFVSAGGSERRMALSRAVEVNEAWRIVRDPIRRAEALFTLAGVAVGETREPPPSPALLMEVMELREELAEARARGDEAVQSVARQVAARAEAAERNLADRFRHSSGEKQALESLVPTLGELRFWRRFEDELSH